LKGAQQLLGKLQFERRLQQLGLQWHVGTSSSSGSSSSAPRCGIRDGQEALVEQRSGSSGSSSSSSSGRKLWSSSSSSGASSGVQAQQQLEQLWSIGPTRGPSRACDIYQAASTPCVARIVRFARSMVPSARLSTSQARVGRTTKDIPVLSAGGFADTPFKARSLEHDMHHIDHLRPVRKAMTQEIGVRIG